jgi:hypothetical protein
MQKLTTINLPHGTLEHVGELLKLKGFTLGTVGGGYGQMELEGTLTDEERTDLTARMAAIVFEFEEQDLDEENEPRKEWVTDCDYCGEMRLCHEDSGRGTCCSRCEEKY